MNFVRESEGQQLRDSTSRDSAFRTRTGHGKEYDVDGGTRGWQISVRARDF